MTRRTLFGVLVAAVFAPAALPARRITRRCYKRFDNSVTCPYAPVDYACDKSFDDCQSHGMTNYFSGANHA